MLEISNLSVTYGKRTVIDDLTVSLEPGQLVVILGENGAGKSSLLQTIAGNLPYHGSVRLHGKEISHWPVKGLAPLRAVMEQHNQAPAGLSVLELVAMSRYWCHESESQSIHCASRWLQRLQLTDYANQEIGRLSGGEQQRAHLARCLAQLDTQPSSPQLMLLDEPTAALDIYYQHQCLQRVKQFAHDGNLVVCIMHDLNLASLYADTILMLHQGVLCHQGRPDAVFQQPILHQIYGTPMHVSQHPDLHVPMIFSEPQSSHRNPL